MTGPKRQEDRRIQRTRQALQQAFIEIMREKGRPASTLRAAEKRFATTSIQEITEQANVNRGTFYLHFSDKYILVDSVVRERFRQQLATTVSSECRWDKQSIQLLTQVVLDIFEKKYQHQKHPALVLAPIVEQAIHDELTALFLTWLKEATLQVRQHEHISSTIIAQVVSATLFGTALEWSQNELDIPLEEMADVIAQMIMVGVSGLLSATP